MLSESRYLERLVSDLLDLAKLQSPDFSIEMQEVDPKEIVEDAARSIKHIAEHKNIALELSILESEKIFPLKGDYQRLRQMLIIVLDNAVKFSSAGSSVRLDLHGADGGIKVSVRDDGRGIEQDDLAHVFERFHKQHSEDNKDGIGLGLAIAKHIADRHGISIEITSKIGVGTEVVFLHAY
jgi:signal transduction histidine kinase